MSRKPLYLKPRGASELVAWEEIAVDAPEVAFYLKATMPSASPPDCAGVRLPDH